MELINFVFGVVKEISPITQEEHATLRAEIQADIEKVVTDETSEHYKPSLKAKILKFFRNPWIRLLMACSFLLVIKGIKDWYNGKYDENEDIEE